VKDYNISMNNKGSALVLSLLVLTVLIILSSGFFLMAGNELNVAKRYRDSTAAFWLAEAGINRFKENMALLDGGALNVDFSDTYPNYLFSLSKSDTSSDRTVTAVGTVNNISRSVVIKYQPNPPNVFNTTISSGGNIIFTGNNGQLDVYGSVDITGVYSEAGTNLDEWFEDKDEGVVSTSATFTIPDVDSNGTPDEFSDFVSFYQNLASTYLSDEVVYIVDDGTQVITPNESLAGKKIIFVEGSSAGTGDVSIVFGASWADDQNLTIISTGTVDYTQALTNAADSTLNIIAWEGYTESAVLEGQHNGVIYTHGIASIESISADSQTIGSIIANDGITIDIDNADVVNKSIMYESPMDGNMVPPGFEGLQSDAPAGYYSEPYYWGEI